MDGEVVFDARSAVDRLYTPPEALEAVQEAQRTEPLMREVLQFANAAPQLVVRLSSQPLVLWRHLATPNFELLRFLDDEFGAAPG